MKARVPLSVIAGLVIVAFAAGFYPPVQTWYVNCALSNIHTLEGSIGSLSAGLNEVEIKNLVLKRANSVLVLPEVHLKLPVATALLKHNLNFSRIEATDWTLDLSQWTSKDFGNAKRDSVGLAKSALALSFQGIISELSLPLGLSIDDIHLQGDVLLPPAPKSSEVIRVHVNLTGGKMQVGKEAHFAFSFISDSTGTAEVPLDAVSINGVLDASMNTSHSFSSVSIRVDAAARGIKIPLGVSLQAIFSATEMQNAETYAFTLNQKSKQLLNINSVFSRSTSQLNGTWNVNASDADIEPFILGRLIPVFNLSGQGSFTTDAALTSTQVSGSIEGDINHIGYIYPVLSSVGEVHVVSQFDLLRSHATLRVNNLDVHVSKSKPVLELTSLQAFAFNSKTGELQVADASKSLIGVNLNAMPLNWLKSWMGSYEVKSGELQGRCELVAGKGGLAFKSVDALRGYSITILHHNQFILNNVDLSSPMQAIYTPQGWQLDLSDGRLINTKSGISFAVKWGRLAGAEQPLKVAAHIDSSIQSWLDFSYAHGLIPHISKEDEPHGHVIADLTASLGQEKISILRFTADHLELPNRVISLPDIQCELTLNESRDGEIAFTAPVFFVEPKDRTELLFVGEGNYRDDVFHFKAQLTSDRVNPVIFGLFKGLVFKKTDETGPKLIPIIQPPKQPFWFGVNAVLDFNLKEVAIAGNPPGRISGIIDCGSQQLSLKHVLVGYAKSGDIQLDAKIDFEQKSLRPYSLIADIKTRDWNIGSILNSNDELAKPSIEGKFDLEAHVVGRGASLDELTQRLHGECTLTSKGGSFGMLNTRFMPKLEKVGKLDKTLSYVNSVSVALIGKKLPADLTNTVAALTTFTKTLSPLRYDQLSVTISRDDTLDTELKDFTLIAPEVRIGGIGRISELEGISLINQPLAMDFRLRARGHLAEALKVAGLLNSKKPDDLGYFPCTLPVQIMGTIAHPDVSDFQAKLEKIAMERSGADELLGRILGN